MRRTIILGAGLSGLSAATHLRDQGIEVKLIDKGRGVGGRLATRRMGPNGTARADHGAQFFTTRGDDFVNTAEQALADGAVMEWCRGFGEADGYPRYCGTTGMTDLAKWMAQGHDITLGAEVDRIESDGKSVSFVGPDGAVMASADDAIVTAPIPQMLNLFNKGNVSMPPELRSDLERTSYFATLGLLAVVEGEHHVAEPGGMQFNEGPFTFIADNQRKGISPVTVLTFHAEHDYSLRRFDDDADQVHAELIEMAKPWLGQATIVESQLKKWRYAGPVMPLPEPTYMIQAGQARVALAGDAFAGPKVEGAFNSGLAAARSLSVGQ